MSNGTRFWTGGALAAMMTAALVSCHIGPDYVRPSLTVPTTYKSATEKDSEPPKLTQDWWRIYQDPELTSLEEQALEANQSLKAAMARVAEARAAVGTAKSAFYPVVTMDPSVTRSRRPVQPNKNQTPPTISTSASTSTAGVPTSTTTISGSHTGANASSTTSATLNVSPTGAALSGNQSARKNLSPAATGTTANVFQVPFDLSYEVDIWGRVRRSVEASQAAMRGSLFDVEVVRQTLLADVAQDYFNIRSLDEQDDILLRNLALFKEEVELTQTQYKAGLVSETNVAQAEVQLEATKVQEIEIRRQRADLEHALAVLLGRPPSEFALACRDGKLAPPAIPAGLPADLLRARPDVAEAEQNLAEASAQIGVAMAAYYPTIKLTGSAGFESVDIEHAADWQRRLLSFGPGVSLPIFEGGKLKAGVEQAKARYEELQAVYRNAVLTAFQDVEVSLTDLHMRVDESEASEKSVKASRDYLDLTRRQYQTGLANYLQVIDAERTLLTNELTAAQLLNQRMVSSALFIKALGGGWDSEAATAGAGAPGRPAPDTAVKP